MIKSPLEVDALFLDYVNILVNVIYDLFFIFLENFRVLFCEDPISKLHDMLRHGVRIYAGRIF